MKVHLSNEDVFSLFAPDIGKSHYFIVWCQMNGLIDLSVLAYIDEVLQIDLEPYLYYANWRN